MSGQDTMDRYATARYVVKEAWEAKWARRIAVFFLQLLILTAILHRFAGLGTPAAVNLIAVSTVGLALAVFIAIVSLIRIWFGGQTGAANDFAAIIVGLIGLALPVFILSKAFMLPTINDVQTSPADPLQFTVLLEQRPPDANPLISPDPETVLEQAESYPDIEPMFVERSAPAVFNVVGEAINQLGWTVVVNEAPGESGVGRIEASDGTLIMGFTDDVVVRVKGNDTAAIIDIRSASRYGEHDFGANAQRIRSFYEEVNTALEKGEKTVLEQAAEEKKEEPVAAPARKAKKKKRQRRKRRRVRRRR